MKKEYMKPQMEVVRIHVSGALLVDSKVDTVAGNGGWNWGGGSSSGGRSRESDDWDDEW